MKVAHRGKTYRRYARGSKKPDKVKRKKKTQSRSEKVTENKPIYKGLPGSICAKANLLVVHDGDNDMRAEAFSEQSYTESTNNHAGWLRSLGGRCLRTRQPTSPVNSVSRLMWRALMRRQCNCRLRDSSAPKVVRMEHKGSTSGRFLQPHTEVNCALISSRS